MLITIDTEFLIKNKLSATQFVALYLIKEREIDLLMKFLKETDTLDNFIQSISKLIKQGFILDYRADMYDFKYLEVNDKFVQLVSGGDLFQELIEYYPKSVIRPDGRVDYLLTDLPKAKKTYTKLTQNNKALHQHIIQCLKEEIEEKEDGGGLAYMKRLPKWISEKSWNTYSERVRSLFEDGNSLGYGETIE